MNKNIIVTGGLGFIGSNLINFLLKKNFFVINIDKVSYSSNFYNTKNFIYKKKYKFIKSDIGDNKKIKKIILKYKPLAIFNLAAETHVDRSIDTPINFVKNNILSLFNLLETIRKSYKFDKKFKFIHISTDEVFGDILKGRSKEGSSYKPSSPYAASKASSDHLVYSYYRTFKLPIIVTNCCNNYGSNQHPEKLIPKIIFNILNNLPLPIYGSGNNSREWIYVEDHCKALFTILKKGKLGEFYNIGSGQNISNNKIAKILLKISQKYHPLGSKVKIKYVNDRPGHDFRYALNNSKIKQKLNWENKTKLEEGLDKTFKWYFDNNQYFKFFKKKDILSRMGVSID